MMYRPVRVTHHQLLVIDDQNIKMRTKGRTIPLIICEKYMMGIKVEMSYGDVVFGVASTITTNGAAMRSPWGVNAAYTKAMIKDFNHADGDAFLVTLSYDLRGNHGILNYRNFGFGQNDPLNHQRRRSKCSTNS